MNDLTLTCTWYNPPPSSVPSTPIAKLSVGGGESASNPAAAESEEVAAAAGLYDDVEDPAYADYEDEAPENEEGVDYDYGDEEDMVDYD